jgi:hypothetical protein
VRTQCQQTEIVFQGLEGRRVVADFEGGYVTSDAGALVLRQVSERLGLVREMAKAFTDARDSDRVEHSVQQLLAQRVLAIALGYEDLNDHDRLRHDPLMGVLAGKADPTGVDRRHKRDRGKSCAGKSTLNRLELSPDLPVHQAKRYHKINYDERILDDLLVRHFLGSWREVPDEIVLDLDATDDPLHGRQEGRFFHGYYDCYCYLPLYIFCGDYLLCARLRPSNIDASAGWEKEVPRIVSLIRSRWPKTRIILRGDSGFARDELMSWCEGQADVHYVFGLARNRRLETAIAGELLQAKAEFELTRQAVRRWKELRYKTLESWSRERRVVAKAEWIEGGDDGKANPRFIVSSLGRDYLEAQSLYEQFYCARGEMENRIKEQQLDLFADRTSTGFMRSNQLRLYLSSFAYVLVNALRQIGLRGTQLAEATVGTIRTRLFKAGALIRVSVRRVLVSFSTGWPMRDVYCQIAGNLATRFG